MTRIHCNLFSIYKLFILCAFAGVIFCPSVAFAGAVSGLNLWAKVILPGLFPALIITSCILALFPMNNGLSYLYVMTAGILCGFPVGALLCGQLHKRMPHEKLCESIMGFCNLSSPSFVVNYILKSNCCSAFGTLKILGCIYLPVIEIWSILLLVYRQEIFFNAAASPNSSVGTETAAPDRPSFAFILDDAIWGAIKSMLKLGGYIVVFSCLSSYVLLLPIRNPALSALICGITEITNGIYLCNQLTDSASAQLLLILGINAFGGLSTIMQTSGMIRTSGLGIKKYIYQKVIFTAVTLLNTTFLIYVL